MVIVLESLNLKVSAAISFPMGGVFAYPKTPQLQQPRWQPSSTPITIMLLGKVSYITRILKIRKRSWKYFSIIFRFDENMTPSISYLCFIAVTDFFSPQRWRVGTWNFVASYYIDNYDFTKKNEANWSYVSKDINIQVKTMVMMNG